MPHYTGEEKKSIKITKIYLDDKIVVKRFRELNSNISPNSVKIDFSKKES